MSPLFPQKQTVPGFIGIVGPKTGSIGDPVQFEHFLVCVSSARTLVGDSAAEAGKHKNTRTIS
jgi:hypothetical protein